MLIPLIRGTEGVNKSIILALSLFITLPAAAQTITITASSNNGDRDTTRPGLQVDEGDIITFGFTLSTPLVGDDQIQITANRQGTAWNSNDLRSNTGSSLLPAELVQTSVILKGRRTDTNLLIVMAARDGITETDETITVSLTRIETLIGTSSYTIVDPSSVTVTILGTPEDYDTNDNGLIDITTLAQLNAIRWDLNGDGDVSSGNAANYLRAFPRRDTNAATRMGCPSGTCTGYELRNDLNFDENGNGSRDDTYNTGVGWNPIGEETNAFTATFSGSGHTIANLFINRSGTENIGLFGVCTGRLTDLGLVNVAIIGGNDTGGLCGENTGTVSTSYVTGQVRGNDSIGSLVGYNLGGTITASYATGRVTGVSTVGGLVGFDTSGGTITTSYATSQVTANSAVGGLVGSGNSITTVTASYWDTETTGQSSSAGSPDTDGKTTAELQTPTGYTGIYANWNVNVDGVTGNDDPWAFGENYQYPVLRHGRTPAQINVQFYLQSRTGAIADINQDGRLNAQDAILMYQTYLPGYGVDPDIAARATTWQENGRAVGGDLNSDGPINHRDALIMYYAYEFGDLLDQSAVLRQLLLNGVRGRMPDTDATYRELLRRANRLQ